jgi:(1->4)-alpha-D-glucan 1-alpha-D-glucosylmutase
MKQHPSIPTATYRLQFNKEFTFAQARALLPQLAALGVSHIYASPYFRASPGSMHGYDVCDPNSLNPEIGTQEEYDAYVDELHRLGMGQIVDFVPNHMGIAEASNEWWMDVLENGPSSPYARFFDIDWHPVKAELANKVLLPILGDQYGRVLESGDLKLLFADGAFFLEYFGRRLPIAPRTTLPLLEKAATLFATEPGAGDALAELQSIITAIGHLPERTETNPAKVAERTREKEIIKRRLARLCAGCEAARVAITRVVDEIQGGLEGFDAFDRLISAQPYRLAYWRVAAEEINYRRFFDINNLAAIRMELPEVFAATHRFLFELMERGAVTGLRIDHVDGLYDPRTYLEKLQHRYAELVGAGGDARPLYLLVEKILGTDERLRPDWPIHGTTGYEFANQANAVLVDAEAASAFTEIYTRFIGMPQTFPEVAYAGKLQTMRVSMSSEVNVLGHMLNRLSETNRWYRDFTLNALTTAVRELIACFPVYRTYVGPDGEASDDDRRVIDRALRTARRRNPAIERSVFEFVRDVLLPPADKPRPLNEEARLDFVLKFQQCTGPITAKGVEDTAFYIYNRLVALNEVGGDPGLFGASVETFHRQNEARAADFPHSLLATSTHDTKRSEDVRARIAALSEIAPEWGRAVRRFHTATRKHRTEVEGECAPDANEEYLLYQTLNGTWPLHPMDMRARKEYIARIGAYMRKALREAKVNSSWVEVNEKWEEAVENFAGKILSGTRGNRFLKLFEPLAERIAQIGACNALSQLVLKTTVPGVPDVYQGQELWDFSLVDPDNRRPVDYAARARLLAEIKGQADVAGLCDSWRDGRIKLFTTHRLLALRAGERALFEGGSYVPLHTTGTHAASVIAFLREHAGKRLLVVVPRLTSRIGFWPLGDLWADTRIDLASSAGWRNVFTGEMMMQTPEASPRVADVLRAFPVAALTG